MMDWVYDGLYVGSIRMIHRQDEVKEEGITAIVRLDLGNYGDYEWSKRDFKVMHIPFPDGEEIPYGVIPKVTRFIHDQIEGGGTVFVHCAMGISRSTTLTMAYLIEYEGMSLAEAFGTVREGRTQAFPHPCLLASLIDHYKLPYHPSEPYRGNFLSRLLQDV